MNRQIIFIPELELTQARERCGITLLVRDFVEGNDTLITMLHLKVGEDGRKDNRSKVPDEHNTHGNSVSGLG